MTYGEMQDFVLQLLNEYSVAGSALAVNVNNQADLKLRIPGLVRDGLYYVTTTVRRLRTVAQLEEAQEVDGTQIFELPQDCYQPVGGLLLPDGRRLRRYSMAGRRIYVPRQSQGLRLEYFRYPRVPTGEAGEVLDCPEEALMAVAYYAAAHLAMEDNNYLHGALYNEFERKLLRLSEGVVYECGTTEDVYG